MHECVYICYPRFRGSFSSDVRLFNVQLVLSDNSPSEITSPESAKPHSLVIFSISSGAVSLLNFPTLAYSTNQWRI